MLKRNASTLTPPGSATGSLNVNRIVCPPANDTATSVGGVLSSDGDVHAVVARSIAMRCG
jgi:hypothetical protein